jgi:large subunit ribosomal protein L24e
MANCSFCGNNFQNKGKMYVLKSGKILYFCTSKCEKNHHLGRKGRNMRWTSTAHGIKESNAPKKEVKKVEASTEVKKEK